MTTLHHKVYASIAIYQPTTQPYPYSENFQYQYVGAVQDGGVAQVPFSVTNTGSLKDEEDSTSLATLTAL